MILAMNPQDYERLTQDAGTEVEETLDALPPDIRARAEGVPITFEEKPNTAMAAAGIHPDRTLGLFTGVPYPLAMAVSQRLPPQIVLFIGNIWNAAGHEPAIFRFQVRKTLLHEIGHYLGLDEQGVRIRNLG